MHYCMILDYDLYQFIEKDLFIYLREHILYRSRTIQNRCKTKRDTYQIKYIKYLFPRTMYETEK